MIGGGLFMTTKATYKELQQRIKILENEIKKQDKYKEKLRASEEKYRSLVESTEDNVYMMDRNYRFLYMNPKYLLLHGLTANSYKGKSFGEFHSQEATKLLKKRIDHVFNTGKSITYLHHRKEHGKYFIRTLSPIFAQDGRVNAVTSIAKDITLQKQIEREVHSNRLELAHLERLATMGELTASLTHELSQPLTAILSNAQTALRLIRSNPPDINEVQAILEDIIADDRRASNFIKHLRTLFKKDELEKKSLNINSIIEQVVSLFKSEAILREISIKKALDGKLPFVKGNDIQLQQVILNLLLNASESMMKVNSRSKKIIISTMRENESHLRIGIRDFGKGVDQEIHASIFKPYFTTKREGMGMGLAICRSIVETHEGKIWLENNPDQGVTFYFTLPTTDEG